MNYNSFIILTLILGLGFLTFYNYDNKLALRQDGKIQIDVLVESLCPYSQDYVLNSFQQAITTKDFDKICNYNLHWWGLANRKYEPIKQEDGFWKFDCFHGDNECYGNLILTCAQE